MEMVEAEAVAGRATGFVGEGELVDVGLEGVEFGFDGGFREEGGSLGADEQLLSAAAAAT